MKSDKKQLCHEPNREPGLAPEKLLAPFKRAWLGAAIGLALSVLYLTAVLLKW